jgi:intein/homing endonuclease
MARQIQHLLARFGIVSLLRGLERQGVLDAVDLWIASKIDVLRFIDEIGFIGEKADRAEQVRAALYNIRMAAPPPERLGPILFDRVYAIDATECAPVYDLAIADVRNFVANDFVVHNPRLAAPTAPARLAVTAD